MKSIYELKEHETTQIGNLKSVDFLHSGVYNVTKVSSGWIYQSVYSGDLTFVPDNRREHTTGPG